MEWQNLLSGTIRALIGALAVLGSTVNYDITEPGGGTGRYDTYGHGQWHSDRYVTIRPDQIEAISGQFCIYLNAIFYPPDEQSHAQVVLNTASVSDYVVQ